MSLRQRLDEDVKQAMRDKDEVRRDALRYIRSEIHNQEIASQTTLDDDEGVSAVLSKQAQQRRESIEAFKEAGREDLVKKEEGDLAVILEYLPQQLTSEEIRELAREAIQAAGASGPADIGKVMGQLIPQTRGRAEGREVSEVVKEILASL